MSNPAENPGGTDYGAWFESLRKRVEAPGLRPGEPGRTFDHITQFEMETMEMLKKFPPVGPLILDEAMPHRDLVPPATRQAIIDEVVAEYNRNSGRKGKGKGMALSNPVLHLQAILLRALDTLPDDAHVVIDEERDINGELRRLTIERKDGKEHG